MLLFYDTETTGLPLWNAPSEHKDQPHLVQLAAALVDPATRRIIQSIDVIIHPLEWQIPEEVSKIHGITHDRAFALGIDETAAISVLMQLADSSELLVGHNESFDRRILRIGLMRYGRVNDAEIWKGRKSACTQALSTPILKLPPTERMKAAGHFHHKSANLTEAYEHLTGKPMQNAHSAMADVMACMEVFFAIQDRQQAA